MPRFSTKIATRKLIKLTRSLEGKHFAGVTSSWVSELEKDPNYISNIDYCNFGIKKLKVCIKYLGFGEVLDIIEEETERLENEKARKTCFNDCQNCRYTCEIEPRETLKEYF